VPYALLRQRPKEIAEGRHLLAENLQPGRWIPNLDADYGAHEHRFLIGGDAEKFPKRVRQ
jgi:hypothetical protein